MLLCFPRIGLTLFNCLIYYFWEYSKKFSTFKIEREIISSLKLELVYLSQVANMSLCHEIWISNFFITKTIIYIPQIFQIPPSSQIFKVHLKKNQFFSMYYCIFGNGICYHLKIAEFVFLQPLGDYIYSIFSCGVQLGRSVRSTVPFFSFVSLG